MQGKPILPQPVGQLPAVVFDQLGAELDGKNVPASANRKNRSQTPKFARTQASSTTLKSARIRMGQASDTENTSPRD